VFEQALGLDNAAHSHVGLALKNIRAASKTLRLNWNAPVSAGFSGSYRSVFIATLNCGIHCGNQDSLDRQGMAAATGEGEDVRDGVHHRIGALRSSGLRLGDLVVDGQDPAATLRRESDQFS
jgi:hypothetical protein